MYYTYCVIFFTLFLSTLATIIYKIKPQIPLKYSLLIGFIIRLIVLFIFLDVVHYDVLSYITVGQMTLKGLAVYPKIAYDHHPYLPFMLYIEALDALFVRWRFHSMLFLKLFFICFDLLMIKAIDLLSSNRTNALLYAVFPAGILLTAGHGQIDNVVLPLILFSIFYLQCHKSTLSTLLMSFAILVKTWPLMLVPFFIHEKKNYKKYVLFALFPLLSIFIYIIVFKSSFLDIIYPPLSYRGAYGNRGISILLSFILPLEKAISYKVIKVITNVLTAISIFIALRYKTNNLTKKILIYFLIFSTIVISGTNPIWLVPFVIIIRPKYSLIWLLLTGIYMGVSMLNYSAPISFQSFTNSTTIFIAFLLWIIQILMLYQTLRLKSYTLS